MSGGPGGSGGTNQNGGPSTSSWLPSLDSLKNIASDVGIKVSSAKHAIERRINEAIDMFPVIDLTSEDQSAGFSGRPGNHVADSWICLTCTYAANPASSNSCNVCQHVRGAEMSSRSTGDRSADEPILIGMVQPPARRDQSLYPVLSSIDFSPTRSTKNEPVQLVDPLSWSCARCTLSNPHTQSKCSVCGASKTDTGTAVSSSSHEPRPQPSRPERTLERRPSREQSWSCASCTFFNPLSGNVCLMCSTPKPGSVDKSTVEKFEAEDVESLREFHEQETLTQWEGIVQFCRQDKNAFVDDRFPPVPSSLAMCKPPADFQRVQNWLRPSQFRRSSQWQGGGDGWTVCRTPLASDIRQGILGDCWFLCALSVVAERPELIFNVLMTREFNKEGAYLIRLCIGGLWKVILVDDLFPVDGAGALAFSQAGRKQLWVPLIEKALAKAHGSYLAIEGGFVNEGLMFLTGAPCDRINLEVTNAEAFDSIWGRLLSCHSAGFLMGASCGKPNESLNEEECRNAGLRPRHSYSLLDVVDADGNRLVRLRDPWGKQAWRGDWSDSSKRWTPALREQLQPRGGSEGLFWISLQDFVKFFDTVDISKYRKHWKEIRVQGTFPNCALYKSWSVWRLTVSETTEVDFTLFQQDYRGASTEMNAHHLDLAVLVFSIHHNGRLNKLVASSKRSAFSFVGTSKLLDCGTYIVWTVAFNHFNDMILPVETFPKNVLAFHTAKTVAVERLAAPKLALADAVICWAMKNGTSSTDRDGVISYSVMTGGLVLVYENRHPGYCVQLMCDCTQSRDVVSTRGVLLTVDLIPPLTRMVVCVLSPSHGSSFYIHYSARQRLCSPYDGLGDWGPPNTRHLPDVDTDLLRDLHLPRPIL